MAKLIWNGEDLKAKKDRACIWGVNKTLENCVRGAKREHKFKNRSSTLEGSIQARPAQKDGNAVKGEWGSYNLDYAASIEGGSKAHDIPNAFGKGITVRHPGIKALPFLRPQADKHYPKLLGLIKQAMSKGSKE
jgi:hypothetical protein